MWPTEVPCFEFCYVNLAHGPIATKKGACDHAEHVGVLSIVCLLQKQQWAQLTFAGLSYKNVLAGISLEAGHVRPTYIANSSLPHVPASLVDFCSQAVSNSSSDAFVVTL